MLYALLTINQINTLQWSPPPKTVSKSLEQATNRHVWLRFSYGS